MRSYLFQGLNLLSVILFPALAHAEDPYLPFNKNGTLIVPEATPRPTTVNSPPTYDLTPNLGTPSQSTIPVPSTPNNGRTTPPTYQLTPTPASPGLSAPTPAQPTPALPSPLNQNQPQTQTQQPPQTTPQQSAPAQSHTSQFGPTVVTPGTLPPPQPAPYYTGYRGTFWNYLWAPSWTQQTNYGPNYGGEMGVMPGYGSAPCGTCPNFGGNFEFGRGYDGFTTGW